MRDAQHCIRALLARMPKQIATMRLSTFSTNSQRSSAHSPAPAFQNCTKVQVGILPNCPRPWLFSFTKPKHQYRKEKKREKEERPSQPPT